MNVTLRLLLVIGKRCMQLNASYGGLSKGLRMLIYGLELFVAGYGSRKCRNAALTNAL